MGRIILYILILGFLKKQNLSVEEPQWPRFLFEGWIVYPDTTPVKDAKVILVPVVFMFADTMPEESTYTDFKGYFTFSDSLFKNSVPHQRIYKIPFLKIRNQF